MIDIVFFFVLLVTPPTTTRCDIYLDASGQTYETCWEKGELMIAPEPSPAVRVRPLPAPSNAD